MPTFEELENPKYDLASIVYDAKGRPFGKYYVENREQITKDELSPYVHDALISTEDARFYGHSGIDFQALMRVAFKTILFSNESSGGGSTISQQLAKLLFKRPSTRGMSTAEKIVTMIQVKLKEWIIAAKLEKQYTKDEIMTMYLNKFEFINGAHGVQAASQTYFGKSQSELEPQEAAVLVGMLKNPSLFNPIRFPDKAKARRNVVLSQMKNYDVLESEAYDTLVQKEMDMSNFQREAHDIGPAPYFRSELTKWLNKLLKEENIKKPDGSAYNIYTDGLKIQTTIDLDYQRLAEESVKEHMAELQKKYFRVWKGMNPWSHDADEMQKKIRYDVLNKRAKESERYLALHNRFLSEIKTTLQEKYNNIPLNENAIKALINIENKKSNFNDESKYLKGRFYDEYKRLLKDEKWNVLKEKYNALQEEFDKEFKTKIPLNVFDYKEGEVQKEMSPLDSVKFHNQHLQNGFLAIEPQTGYIKAWVGGIGFKYFKYDHINSRRQVGSTIKPFVYSTAISLQGVSPCQEYEDIQYTIVPGDANLQVDTVWSPANANGEFTGNKYNLYQGLLYSKNSITVRLVKEMGSVDVIREVLDNAGISKSETLADGRLLIPRVPSICLGAMDLSLMEMAGAYTTFANNGVYTEPVFVSRIEDKNGKVLYVGVPEKRQALNPLHNAVMLDMLQNNVGRNYGMGVQVPIGGKTGTTNDYSDGWFMSVTPNLVMGTWVGGDDSWIRFLTLENGQGFVMARPIVRNFVKKIEKDSLADFNSKATFPEPPDGFYDLINCDKYKQIKPEDEQEFRRLQRERYNEFEEVFEDEFEDEFESDGYLEFDEELEEDLPSTKPVALPVVDTVKTEAIKKDTTSNQEKEEFEEEFEEGGGN